MVSIIAQKILKGVRFLDFFVLNFLFKYIERLFPLLYTGILSKEDDLSSCSADVSDGVLMLKTWDFRFYFQCVFPIQMEVGNHFTMCFQTLFKTIFIKMFRTRI